MTGTRLVHCTFPKGLIREPLLYNLGRDFEVVPNIRGATISDDIGLVYLELEGIEPEIEKALQYLAERGVSIADVAGDVPAAEPPSQL
ncbi:MAG: FeS-binding protein [Planctomycetota bacterium]|nr:MAG: FeS-binding protein [Planctomycetota bacterium]